MLLVTGYKTYKKQHQSKGQNYAGLGWRDNEFINTRQVSRKKRQQSLISGVVYPMFFDREAYKP